MALGDLLQAIVPVFAVILIGYAATTFDGFSEELAKGLNLFVYYVALPALIFQSISGADLSRGVPGTFLVANLACVAAAYALGMGFALLGRGRSLPTANAIGMVGAWGNVAYLGIPLLVAILGTKAAFPAAIGALVHNLLSIATFLLFAGYHEHRGGDRRGPLRSGLEIARAVVVNPLTLSGGAGLLAAALQLQLPKPLHSTVSLLAPVAAPGALFALGIMLRRAARELRGGHLDRLDISLAVAIKIIAMPLMALALVRLALPVPAPWRTVTVAMAALPNAATVFVLTQKSDIYVSETTAAVVASTVLSIVTIPVFLLLI